MVTITIDTDAAPASVPDAYLRLHLLSHRLMRPHDDQPRRRLRRAAQRRVDEPRASAADRVEQLRPRCAPRGQRLQVTGLDSFPRMTDYVTPSGVRIADADRVRLGAHLADGTVVMHEGFCNYNAGTLGQAMIEGRISQGVIIGAGTRPRRRRVDHGHAVGRRHRAGHRSASGA